MSFYHISILSRLNDCNENNTTSCRRLVIDGLSCLCLLLHVPLGLWVCSSHCRANNPLRRRSKSTIKSLEVMMVPLLSQSMESYNREK